MQGLEYEVDLTYRVGTPLEWSEGSEREIVAAGFREAATIYTEEYDEGVAPLASGDIDELLVRVRRLRCGTTREYRMTGQWVTIYKAEFIRNVEDENATD